MHGYDLGSLSRALCMYVSRRVRDPVASDLIPVAPMHELVWCSSVGIMLLFDLS
jgi:hypothetical protein